MRILLILLVLTALGAGGWWYTRPQPIPVRVHSLERGPVRATVANTRVGTVEACSRARMSPSMPGIVAALPLREGDEVQAGQVLMEIWNEDLKAELNHVGAEIVASRKRADEACAQAAGARREADRIRGLAGRKLVAQEALDRAQTLVDASEAGCAAAKASITTASARRDVVSQQIEKGRLRAPFSGVVAEINAKLGEFLTPSPTGIPTLPAIDLIDMSCLYVSAPIDEIDAPQIKPGLSACVSLDAFEGRRCGAKVRRVAPYVLEREKQARTVEVEVEMTRPEDIAGLLPGYSADIEILVREVKDTLRVPTEAVFDGDTVLLFNPDSQRLEKKSFAAGVSNWEYTEVLSGLVAGEQVVTSVGRKGVEAGALARPIRSDDEASDDDP